MDLTKCVTTLDAGARPGLGRPRPGRRHPGAGLALSSAAMSESPDASPEPRPGPGPEPSPEVSAQSSPGLSPDLVPRETPAPGAGSGAESGAESGAASGAGAGGRAGGGGAGRRVVRRLITDPFGKLGGVVVGAVIGLAVEAGVESTGVMGPGVEEILAKQADGFALIESKLESLKQAETLEQALSLAGEIETQLAQQQANSERLGEELRGARQEIDRLRAVALETSGGATGADFWLKPGESISVGSRANTFAVQAFTYSSRTEYVNANVNGVRQRMGVGDIAEFETAEGTYQVVYKLTEPRADGRVGFDLVSPASAE